MAGEVVIKVCWSKSLRRDTYGKPRLRMPIVARGNTYPVRHVFKRLGWRWEGLGWVAPAKPFEVERGKEMAIQVAREVAKAGVKCVVVFDDGKSQVEKVFE